MKTHSIPPTSPDQPLPGFSHSRAQFEALVDSALAHAKRLGASDAAAQASEGCGLSVSVRKGELENVERNRDKSLGITLYVGHRRGNASTSDFSIFVSSCVLASYIALMEAYAVCSHIEGSLTLSIFISQPSKPRATCQLPAPTTKDLTPYLID